MTISEQIQALADRLTTLEAASAGARQSTAGDLAQLKQRLSEMQLTLLHLVDTVGHPNA